MRIRGLDGNSFEVIDNNYNILMTGTRVEAESYYAANKDKEISEEVFILDGVFVNRKREPISLGILSGVDGDFSISGKTTTATLNISAMPTSSTDLVAGDVWNDVGTLKIV